MSPFHSIEMTPAGRSSLNPGSLGRCVAKESARTPGVAHSLDELRRASGGCLSMAKVAATLRCSDRHADRLVRQWTESGRILLMLVELQSDLPAYQLDVFRRQPHAAVGLVLSELRDVFSDVELLLWFVTSSHWLADRTPAALMSIDVRAVVGAARADRFIAGG